MASPQEALQQSRKGIAFGEGGEYSAEFALYGLLEHDAAYCGTDLPTFRWNLITSFNLVEIYRPLDARSVSRFKYREYVSCTVQR